MDGTRARRPAVALEGAAAPQVATKTAAIGLHAVTSGLVARCLAATREHAPRGPVVSRVGVDGASVSFRTASGSDVVACDATAVRAEPDRPWCGVALGRTRKGKLLDPRLDLATCATRSGNRVAFAWIEPARGTRYVGVREDGFVEVYRVVAGLPVRIATTSDIDFDSSSASFDVSEHGADGHVLRTYTLRARVAG